MGFSIITTHLVMLERAFDRSLNTKHPGGKVRNGAAPLTF